MNCPRFESLLSDYRDGQLEAPVLAAVEEHLSSCVECRELVVQVNLLKTELADFPEAMPPAELTDRIMERTSGPVVDLAPWKEWVLPIVKPFLTQRFAFATGIMFLFLSLMTHLLGPGFSGLSASDLSPSALAESGARVSSRISLHWNQFKDARSRFFEEVSLWWEDVGGSVDHHVITGLFKNYQEAVREQQQKLHQTQVEEESSGPEADGSGAQPEERR